MLIIKVPVYTLRVLDHCTKQLCETLKPLLLFLAVAGVFVCEHWLQNLPCEPYIGLLLTTTAKRRLMQMLWIGDRLSVRVCGRCASRHAADLTASRCAAAVGYLRTKSYFANVDGFAVLKASTTTHGSWWWWWWWWWRPLPMTTAEVRTCSVEICRRDVTFGETLLNLSARPRYFFRFLQD